MGQLYEKIVFVHFEKMHLEKFAWFRKIVKFIKKKLNCTSSDRLTKVNWFTSPVHLN